MPRPVRLLPLAISLYLSIPDGETRSEGQPTDLLPDNPSSHDTNRFLAALRTVWQREVSQMPEPDKSVMAAFTFSAEYFDGVPLIFCRKKRGLFVHEIIPNGVADAQT